MRSVAVVFAALAALCLAATAFTPAHAGRLSCGVCEAIVDEVNHAILTTTQTHSVQTRFRVDEKKRTPYARTEYNLMQIMEGEDFVKKFATYGLVTPWTKTARHMKRAYELAALGQEIEPLEPEPKPAAPAAPAAETAPPAGDVAASAAADATSTTPAEGEAVPAAGDATATPAAPVEAAVAVETYVSFRPTGSVPLSLELNHVHLAKRSSVTNTGLRVASTTKIASEIKAAVRDFLEEHLDEAMLMFHRDVPDLKRKLCVETTEVCLPNKRKQAAKATTTPAATKDEL